MSDGNWALDVERRANARMDRIERALGALYQSVDVAMIRLYGVNLEAAVDQVEHSSPSLDALLNGLVRMKRIMDGKE